MIYLFVLFIIVLPFAIDSILQSSRQETLSYENNKAVRSILIFGFLVLFIVGAIRFDVGTDYGNYLINQFPLVVSGIPVKINFLSVKLIQLGYFLGHGFYNYPYQLIFVIFHFIILFFLFRWIYEQSLNIGFSVALIILTSYFSYSLSAMRQSMAISIMLYATKYLKEQHLFKYMLFLFIAFLIHSSILLFLPFYFLAFIRPKLSFVILIQVILLFVYPFGRSILLTLIDKTGLYQSYIGSQFDNGLVSAPLILIILLTTLVVIVSYFFLIDPSSKKKIDNLIWIDIVLFMMLPAVGIFPTVTRVLYILFPVNIVLLPNTLGLVRNKYLRMLLSLFMTVSFFVFFCYFLFKNNGYQTLPYRTIFD